MEIGEDNRVPVTWVKFFPVPILIVLTIKIKPMGFHQYHEPPGELSAEARTFARMITSLTEEAEAIGWY
ncbi:MAG: hypothetical protein JWQ78_88, partial [Sediminibacterium sp.]|nr:hypothetical protein [Sediminibacterium sp.]